MSFIDKMMEMSPGVILTDPADLVVNDLVATLFTVWAGSFGLAVIPWALYRLYKSGDSIPSLMIIGGLIVSVLEPMLDHIGHLWWPTDLPGPAFVGYDLHVPYLIPPCYVFFIAMTGYWAYLKMKQCLDVKGVFVVWFLISMTDLIMEIPGTALGAYTYYGDASFKIFGFPMAWGWLNGTSMFMTGVLLFLVEPYLKGTKRLLISFVPVIAMGASYGMTAWPYFMSLNWEMPWIATRVLAIFSLLLCILVVRFSAVFVATKDQASLQLTSVRPVPAWQKMFQ